MSAAHSGRTDSQQSASFARIPAHVVYSRDAAGSRRVLEAIVHRSDYRTGLTNGDCSVRQLGAALDLSPGTVHEHIGHLLAAGLLVVHLPAKGVRPTQFRLPWMGHEVIHSARPDRALEADPESLARGETARTARPDRALARGETARSIYRDRTIQSAAAPVREVPRALIDQAIADGRADHRSKVEPGLTCLDDR